MLPKTCFPAKCSPGLRFRKYSLRLNEPPLLAGLQTKKETIHGEATANRNGCELYKKFAEVINSMNSAVSRAFLIKMPERRNHKQRRLPVPEVITHGLKGLHPWETIRASRRGQALKGILSDNILSSKTNLTDLDSALEMMVFVSDYILSPIKGSTKPQQSCLTQKALTLLLAN